MSFIGKINKDLVVIDEKLQGSRLLFYVEPVETDGCGKWIDSYDFFRGVVKAIKPTKTPNNFPSKTAEKNLGKTFKCRTSSCTVTKLLTGSQVVVEFENGYSTTTSIHDIIRGVLRNPTDPSVCGVGYIGIGQYNAVNSASSYKVWTSMLQRADLSEKVSVADEWHDFQNFTVWYKNEINLRKNSDIRLSLEKDILSHQDDKIYSPSTVVLAPAQINSLFQSPAKKKTALPPGVILLSKGMFKVTVGTGDKKIILGPFNNPVEASAAYWEFKAKHWIAKANEYRDYLCDRGYNGIIRKANLILVNNLIPQY